MIPVCPRGDPAGSLSADQYLKSYNEGNWVTILPSSEGE